MRKSAERSVAVAPMTTSGAMLRTDNAVIQDAGGPGVGGGRSTGTGSGTIAGSGSALPDTGELQAGTA